MRHGVVTNGRTTTFYGDHAQRFMMQAKASNIFSQEEALESITKMTIPSNRTMFVEELAKRGFKFEPEVVEALNIRDDEKDAADKVKRVAANKASYRELPLETKTTTSKCAWCHKRIAKGQTWYDNGKGHRAHSTCVAE